jgi:hypothetical protein
MRNLLFLMLLISVNLLILFVAPGTRFDRLVIHHSASRRDNYASIRAYHKKQHGWRDAAYHLILSNGSTAVPAGFLEPTGRYRRQTYSLATRSRVCNLRGIHLCIVGNYETAPLPGDLAASAGHVVDLVMRTYGISERQIRLHRDCNPTACPGKYITRAAVAKWRRNAAKHCSPEIRRQQTGALGLCRVLGLPVPRLYVGASLIVSVGVLILWLITNCSIRGRLPRTGARSENRTDEEQRFLPAKTNQEINCETIPPRRKKNPGASNTPAKGYPHHPGGKRPDRRSPKAPGGRTHEPPL